MRIPKYSFWLNKYLRTLFRICVPGMTPINRFYYPNVVGKAQQVKMQRRSPVFTQAVVLTTNMSIFSRYLAGAKDKQCSVRFL